MDDFDPKQGYYDMRDDLLSRDPNYYSRIGKLGGSVKGVKKGFALYSKKQLQELSRKGGSKSRIDWTPERRAHMSKLAKERLYRKVE